MAESNYKQGRLSIKADYTSQKMRKKNESVVRNVFVVLTNITGDCKEMELVFNMARRKLEPCRVVLFVWVLIL